ncbi:hypothetical protein [Winogradskyella sp.]|uniref:hypothetical protein n=1 Tax=Winogradskyella sp. TaxID=1883156 RepID=UPI0025F63541|nr:hypothetical protein [Winogradskyella sp.]
MQTKVNALKVQIDQSKNVKQLMLLDSLSGLTRNKPEFQYDSIVRKTIDLAKKLDSINLAAMHTANLINFNNNIVGKPEVAIELFNNLMHEYKDISSDAALCQLFINTADSYYYTGEVLKSVEFYKVANKHAKKINSERLMGLAKLYEGYSHSHLGNFSEASIR